MSICNAYNSSAQYYREKVNEIHIRANISTYKIKMYDVHGITIMLPAPESATVTRTTLQYCLFISSADIVAQSYRFHKFAQR